MIRIFIPGEPIAQGRGRAFGFKRGDGTIGARVFDPKKSRDFKATAHGHMQMAMAGRPLLEGPIVLEVIALFSCPKSDYRKREPRVERWHTKKPDGDNVLKAVKDAAKGVLWLDDCQVCDARIVKRIAAQGAAPGLRITVDRLFDSLQSLIELSACRRSDL